MKHLVFYDGNCGFCDQSVQILLRIDSREIFAFAPLQGSTAEKFLTDIPPDSFILVENFQTKPKVYFYGKGALRVLWLLGFPWSLIGFVSFLPSYLYDWIYRFIAKNRLWFFGASCNIRKNNKRFLP